MKTQIRDAVFETNSSSTHSVTIDRDEVVDIALARETLRDGVIRVVIPDSGYGWEWCRYYRPENKIAYMLMQFHGGYLHGDMDRLADNDDHAAAIREDSRCDWFLSMIEKATGCRVEITRRSEDSLSYGIDHQSVGNDMEKIEEAEDILRLVFGSKSYIETGNDNSSPPEKIDTDLGSEVDYFESILVESLPEGAVFRLGEMQGDGWHKRARIRTQAGEDIATPDVTWGFRQRIRDIVAAGDVVIGGFNVVLPYPDGAPVDEISAFARRIAFEQWTETFGMASGLRLLRDFEVTYQLKPFVGDIGAIRHLSGNYHFAAQAEVEAIAVARDDTVARLMQVFGEAEKYAPQKKDPSP